MADEMEEIIAEFVAESEETLDGVEPLFVELEAKGWDKDIINKLFRCVHTVKGAAGFLGFQQIVDVAHGAENIMKKIRDGEIALSKRLTDVFLRSVDVLKGLLMHISSKDGSVDDIGPILREQSIALEEARSASGSESSETAKRIETKEAVPAAGPTRSEPSHEETAVKKEEQHTLRVDIDKIDDVLNLTGELVLVRNRLVNIAKRLEQRRMEDRVILELVESVSFLNLVASDMQTAAMKMRMHPLRKVFNKFPRLVRDISSSLGKEVELRISGAETEVDRAVIEEIGDPLVHILRNAVDHGIEPPLDRKAAGKPGKGLITINAYQKGNQIIIDIEDDGRGIDIDRVKNKAVEKGLITKAEADGMSDDAAIGIIFMPGFSTAEVATAISGRGVGMDVVKTNISKLSGSVEVSAQKGKGTKFTIRLPLTVAIIQTLMVTVAGLRYAVPLAPVEESIVIRQEDVSNAAGARALVMHNRLYPLIDLATALGHRRHCAGGQRYAIAVSIADKRFCIEVDRLIGQEEVVIKRMEGMKASSSHILGATITGDGRVVFILDLASISRLVPDAVTA